MLYCNYFSTLLLDYDIRKAQENHQGLDANFKLLGKDVQIILSARALLEKLIVAHMLHAFTSCYAKTNFKTITLLFKLMPPKRSLPCRFSE
jgi:hypothetical protein